MTRLVLTRYELLRLLRNRRFVVFSLAFPLILFYAIAGPNRHVRDLQHTGIRRRSTSWSDSRPSGR